MATTSIAPPVNRPNTARAVAQARQECARDARWLRAVNRAAVNLETCPWQFDGETLVITSATSDRRYTVTAEGCACKAFWDCQPCSHRAARRLLIKAAQMATQPPVELCPMCQAPIEGRQYYVGGIGYTYFDVCSGDGSHFSRRA